MSNARSPNYPSLSLGKAIEKVNKVYTLEHMHPAPKEVVAKALGYGGLNGASLVIIGALKRYGLLQSEGDGLRVSDDAITVLELPEGEPQHAQALLRLAFNPQLFKELREAFGDSLPSDVNLRHYLIKKKFLPKAADEVIRVYRETLDLVTGEGAMYDAAREQTTKVMRTREGTPSMQAPAVKTATTALPPAAPHIGVTSGGSELAFKISKDSDARVLFSGPVTQEAIGKLLALLELSKDTFPTQQELVTRRAGIWRNKDVDQPVTVLGMAGVGTDGRRYVRIEGSDSGVPEDEIELA